MPVAKAGMEGGRERRGEERRGGRLGGASELIEIGSKL